ncbi:hypothetical protein GGR57DRAFT_518275 [Xylariaceae sp. FL1272]|nr:hypothetical protein GGR57DRAFT_518275 [Xylariaceae sp. FL1272]
MENASSNSIADNVSAYSQSPSPSNHAAFQAQYQQLYPTPSNTFSNQFDISQSQGTDRQGPYNMSAMANALPQTAYRSGYSGVQQHRYAPSAPSMMPQMMPFHGQQQHMPQLANQPYYMPAQIPQYYNTQMPPTSQHQAHQSSLPPRANMNMGYYPNTGMPNQSQTLVTGYYYPPSNHYPVQNASIQSHMQRSQYISPNGLSGEFTSTTPALRTSRVGGLGGEFARNEDPSGNRSNIVRGPPRKPRQSGHAIWVGNLPPQTDLMSLVHHVCKEVTGLESLFLISKSNCAFANFKDEPSCITAQQKLHDSKFQSVRLVSRLRKSTVEGTQGQTAPTGPSATSPPAPVSSEPTSSSPRPGSSSAPPAGGETEMKSAPVDTSIQKDKFFILKSLTVEDLELSVRNGVWATQSHNEDALNKAFGAVDNVYLIFSANKSGEYFGYARMTSSINDDPAAAIEFAPKAQPANDIDAPRAIPTEATDTCPRGRIIDDSARGTIFWEVERDETEVPSETPSEDSESNKSMQDGEGGSKAWGKPFKLEWLSTTRLPFYRARGLRNPWNSNREVKIARDGTELEPTVGRKLIGLFNRVQSPPLIPAMNIRTNMAIAAGFPPQMPHGFR